MIRREEAIENITEIKKCEAGVYAEALEIAIKALEQEPCEDAISRQAAIDAIENEQKKIMRSDWAIDQAKFSAMSDIRALIADLPSVSTEKTDAYKQGWHDAITTALKETHSVHTEDGHFRVVQEETLIGVGMAYEQVSTEKTGRWIPVSERLPEIGQRVLVTYNQEDKLKVDTTIFDRHGFLIGIVTAWMPLPPSYKGESEDNEK